MSAPADPGVLEDLLIEKGNQAIQTDCIFRGHHYDYDEA